jgi:hypothetical protein
MAPHCRAVSSVTSSDVTRLWATFPFSVDDFDRSGSRDAAGVVTWSRGRVMPRDLAPASCLVPGCRAQRPSGNKQKFGAQLLGMLPLVNEIPICKVWAKSGSIFPGFVEKSNAHKHGVNGGRAGKIYTPDADKGVIYAIAFWDPFRRVLVRLFVNIRNFLVLISSRICSLTIFFPSSSIVSGTWKARV